MTLPVTPDPNDEISPRVRRRLFHDEDEQPRVTVGAEPSPLAEDALGAHTLDVRIELTVFQKPFEHLNFLGAVLESDREEILRKDQEYNASWLTRGGVGAFMMLARKWDRLEPLVAKHGYDIFAMLNAHPGRIDDIQDLRRYLALVGAEWQRRLSGLPGGKRRG